MRRCSARFVRIRTGARVARRGHVASMRGQLARAKVTALGAQADQVLDRWAQSEPSAPTADSPTFSARGFSSARTTARATHATLRGLERPPRGRCVRAPRGRRSVDRDGGNDYLHVAQARVPAQRARGPTPRTSARRAPCTATQTCRAPPRPAPERRALALGSDAERLRAPSSTICWCRGARDVSRGTPRAGLHTTPALLIQDRSAAARSRRREVSSRRLRARLWAARPARARRHDARPLPGSARRAAAPAFAARLASDPPTPGRAAGCARGLPTARASAIAIRHRLFVRARRGASGEVGERRRARGYASCAGTTVGGAVGLRCGGRRRRGSGRRGGAGGSAESWRGRDAE